MGEWGLGRGENVERVMPQLFTKPHGLRKRTCNIKQTNQVENESMEPYPKTKKS